MRPIDGLSHSFGAFLLHIATDRMVGANSRTFQTSTGREMEMGKWDRRSRCSVIRGSSTAQGRFTGWLC